MAWNTEMVLLLRCMVDDLDEPPRTEDERLEQLILTSAQLIKTQVNLDTDYTISISDLTLSPDPTATATRDDQFINLVNIQAACLTDRGAAASALRKAIMFRDGGSQVDTRDRARSYLTLLEKGGWCALLADAKLDYNNSQTVDGGIGYAVMSPFRIYASALYPGRCNWLN